MPGDYILETRINHHTITSAKLLRDVKVDCYLPAVIDSNTHLLLINDGQDLRTMKFGEILEEMNINGDLQSVFCVGIHCASDRKNEYGTAKELDYKGRGAKSALFTKFIFSELLPFIRKHYKVSSFKTKSFAGFSLGGLCALDIVWNHAHEFASVGVFSGSLWWRSVSQEDPSFDEKKHRIMHMQVRNGAFHPWLKFFFEVGTLDETADRNNNGIIDAIDDTLALIEELENIGYTNKQVRYLELSNGRHDVQTWAVAFPDYLKWAFGNRVDS